MSTEIDLTEDSTWDTPAKDCLAVLPPEILQNIASYLYATHIPDITTNIRAQRSRSRRLLATNSSSPEPFRDLIALARTNKNLYAQVHDWAHHFLHGHRAITRYRDYKTAAAAAKQRPLTELILWSTRHCAFCGKKSVRTAIFMNGLNCCQNCDREQWPDKITKTEAKKNYKLADHQLLPGQHHGYSLLMRYPGLPTIRYGTYFSQGVLTTMFERADVEVLAELANSDMSGHLQKRRTARKAVQEDKMSAKAGVRKRTVGEAKAKESEIVAIEDDSEDGFGGISSTEQDFRIVALPRQDLDGS